eukprot:gene31313-40685_t
MLKADKATNREDRGDSIVDRADPTQYKIPFETLIETLREVHSKDEDSISVIQRFEEMAIDYWKNDIDLNLFSKVDSTTQHVNHASNNFKDFYQAIQEDLSLKGPPHVNNASGETILEEPHLKNLPIKSGFVDVKVDGLKAARKVFCALNRMIMSTELRAVNSVKYPIFSTESEKYEIIVKGSKTSQFEEEKGIINSNEISSLVKIIFMDEIPGDVEYAVGCIGETVHREDTASVGRFLSKISGSRFIKWDKTRRLLQKIDMP